MHETAKCRDIRAQRGDFEAYLHGQGIDIGAGNDPLRIPNGSVRTWDVNDGDAQHLATIPDESFDFVYSSHCLEHLQDVATALRNWVRVARRGGYLYIVVPDYLLYEKMTWPSMHNAGHLHSFSTFITRSAVNRPNHHHVDDDLVPLLTSLGTRVLRITFEDYGFNYNAGVLEQTMAGAVCQICIVAERV